MPEPSRHASSGLRAGALLSLAAAMAGWGLVILDGTRESRRTTDTALIAAKGADIKAGRSVIRASGCGACHEIPGIPAARGQIGPSLDGLAGLLILAGRLSNTADNLARWILDPPAIAPGTGMPVLGLSEQEAKDAAAYLLAETR